VKDLERRDESMGKTIMGAVVSLDGFIADDNDDVGPLFDWYGNGDVTWSFPGSDGESRNSTRPVSAAVVTTAEATATVTVKPGADG
jgi:hypothetical protein